MTDLSHPVRHAIVGLGSRSQMYSSAILGPYRDRAALVGLCDVNRTRMAFHNRAFADRCGVGPVPTYDSADFARMLAEQQVERVIVTSVDRTHDDYIVAALRHGCDVVTEKPMTTDAEKCQRIIDARAETGRDLTVTFNYRYAPRNHAVKQLVHSGAIGDVVSVHFEWLLDTRHGADYFRRWHRDKRNSGGLMVHKASHHFDLVNWWLADAPETVFAMGDLRFYGLANAQARGEPPRSFRSHGATLPDSDPWAIDLAADPTLRGLYLDAEHEDGYLRDRDVFSDGISIEDDMAVLVRYVRGATLSYHLTAYSPWEGYSVALNGTAGRIELRVTERSYVSGEEADPNAPDRSAPDPSASEVVDEAVLMLYPLHGTGRRIPIDEGSGGHGGGDERLLADVFGEAGEDPLGRAATHRDGALAMLVGAAANSCFATGTPVRIDDLVRFR